MALSLTPDQARKMLHDVESARADANANLKQIEQLQQELLAQGWHGASASKYGQRSEQQQDDFQQVSQILNAAAEKGGAHIQSFISADNG